VFVVSGRNCDFDLGVCGGESMEGMFEERAADEDKLMESKCQGVLTSCHDLSHGSQSRRNRGVCIEGRRLLRHSARILVRKNSSRFRD
jgi:hypothetical protein